MDEDSTTGCVDCPLGTFCDAGASEAIACDDIGQVDLDQDPATPCIDTKHTNAAVHASLKLTASFDELQQSFERDFSADMAYIIGVDPGRVIVQNVTSFVDLRADGACRPITLLSNSLLPPHLMACRYQ